MKNFKLFILAFSIFIFISSCKKDLDFDKVIKINKYQSVDTKEIKKWFNERATK